MCKKVSVKNAFLFLKVPKNALNKEACLIASGNLSLISKTLRLFQPLVIYVTSIRGL